jgi:hypothetical protein
MNTPEDDEFERIEREQARQRVWRESQTEDEKNKRCPTCRRLLDGDHETND